MSSNLHIFLSYSRDDDDIMQRVRTSLQRVGLKVWAGEHLEPGTAGWKKELPQALRDAGAVIVLMSPRANQTEWVAREIHIAKSIKANIIPLLVDGEVHQALLPLLADMEYIDMRDDYDGNIIHVIRLCYEYRQQDDPRTTTELHQAMSTEQSVEDVEKSDSESSTTDNQDVKMFVRHLSESDNNVLAKSADKEPIVSRSALMRTARVMVGLGLLIAGIAVVAMILFITFRPSGSDGEVTPEVVADTTEVTEAVEPTVESQVVEATATDEPTDIPPTEEPEPSETPIPPTDEPTDEPTDIPPTEIPPTDVPPTAIPSATPIPPTAIPTATSVPPTATPLPPSQTPVPTAITVSDGNIELVYNGDTLLVHNISEANVNLTGVQFILIGASDEESVLFLAEEWTLTNNILQRDRCTQVWRVEFAELPASEPPANECGARSSFRSTPRTFWIIDGDKTIFELRRNGAILAQCQAAVRDNNDLLRCMVNI